MRPAVAWKSAAEATVYCSNAKIFLYESSGFDPRFETVDTGNRICLGRQFISLKYFR